VAKFFVSENTLACSDVFRRLSDKLKKRDLTMPFVFTNKKPGDQRSPGISC
jgi:hypothetical protein